MTTKKTNNKAAAQVEAPMPRVSNSIQEELNKKKLERELKNGQKINDMKTELAILKQKKPLNATPISNSKIKSFKK